MVEVVVARAVDQWVHSGWDPGEPVAAVAFDGVEDLVGLPEDEDEDVDFEEGEDDGAGQLS